ncbi:MAG: hypothetical protein K8W52_29085 [Deltaproteobacteria bacterium]|nr:hypothetical protein [Deltaproteobacteria bacterium]
MYRYGDGSPFPFEDNFIEILGAAVDACAAAFTAAAELDALRARARDARRDADDEARRLVGLEKAIETAVFPSRPSGAKDATATQQSAQKILAAVKQQMTAAKGMLEKRVAAANAEPRPEKAAAAASAAMGAFFERHELPGTTWTWRWRASEGSARADATAQVGKFELAFEIHLDAAWRAPVKIASLVPGAHVVLPTKRMFGKPVGKRIALDRCALVKVENAGDRRVLELRAHVSKAARGWRVTLIDDRAICLALDETGKPIGGDHTARPDDAAILGTLADAAIAAIDERRMNRRATELLLGDSTLTALADATIPARAILDQLAPTIKLVRTRSRVPGELIIKRDIADGRREELFLPRAAVAAKFARLPPEYRRVFDDAGLGRDDTNEIGDADLSDADLDTPMTIPAAPPHAPTMALPQIPRQVA